MCTIMKISIIIPAHNEAQYLGQCLESIMKNKHQFLHEIIVVDNASMDNTTAIGKSFQGVRVVHEKEIGVNRARAKGLAVSSGDIIAYLDADTIMPKNWLATVVREFSNDADLVGLSGPYRYYDVTRLHGLATKLYWVFLAVPSYLVLGYMVVGGNFATRRKSLEQIGGFDKNIPFYGDDTDIARKLNKVGKVKFKISFFMHTSGRRLKKQGFLKTGFLYAGNFISEIIVHRPMTKKYKDFR